MLRYEEGLYGGLAILVVSESQVSQRVVAVASSDQMY